MRLVNPLGSWRPFASAGPRAPYGPGPLTAAPARSHAVDHRSEPSAAAATALEVIRNRRRSTRFSLFVSAPGRPHPGEPGWGSGTAQSCRTERLSTSITTGALVVELER